MVHSLANSDIISMGLDILKISGGLLGFALIPIAIIIAIGIFLKVAT